MALLRGGIRARIGNPLEWSNTGKSLASSTLIGVFCAIGQITAERELTRPAMPALPVVEFALQVAGWLRFLILLWALLGCAAWWLHRRSSETRWLLYAGSLLYAVTFALVCYLYGPTTSAFIGFIVIIGGLLGILLFSPKPTFVSGALFFVLVIGTEVAAAKGLIPYGPFAESLRLAYGEQSARWLARSWVTIIVSTAIAMTFFTYIFARWHDREDKLKEAHILLEAQKDQLVRSESLAAVGSLVTGAAHELRNPLGSSSALFQSLKEDLAASHATEEEKRDALATIEMGLKGQRRAALIAERLYSLSDNLVHVDADRPLGAILDALRNRYSSVDFSGVRSGDTDSGVILGQRINDRALTTILSNLLENALAAGGSNPPRLSVVVEVGRTVITISDSGRGIPKAQLPGIFKPFFTGQKAGEGHGVGLGLYIVHELVTRMGGSVKLVSEENRGTQVTVAVPLPDPSAALRR